VTRGIPTARRTARRPLALLLLGLLVVALLPAQAQAGIGARITRILRANGMGGTGTAVTVWAGDPTHAAYSRNATTRLVPASNMKLVISSVALIRWGAEHRFKTELYLPTAPPAEGGVGELAGNIYLKGYGDPSLSTRTYQLRHFDGLSTSTVSGFVRELKDLGVTRIVGRVVGDDSWFDDKYAIGSWKPSFKEEECGPISALTVNEGWRSGETVDDPPKAAAQALTNALEAADIDVTGGPRSGAVPADAYLAVTSYSATLTELLAHMNKQSDNFFAEVMLKGLGRDFRSEGSSAAGLRVERATLDTLAVPRELYRLWDGSGLSYWNRLSTRAVTKLLRGMRGRDDWTTFRGSLAVAATDGTLRNRMKGTAAAGNFRGKTGTLLVASCLSGYVDSSRGTPLVVSIMMNGRPVDLYHALRAQDAIAVALARSRL
jgi:D-alanyl-D-alanine carboxypeptidase/D-alanyl-D-alanine-endopeptidase (penicillin-binding protein 4)